MAKNGNSGILSSRWIVRLLTALMLFFTVLPPVHAKEDDQDQVRGLLQQGKILPLSRIVELLSTHHPGQVLQVELEREGGKRVYEIRMILKGGVLRTFHVDAHTGEILSMTHKEDR